MAGGLGSSTTTICKISYSTFINALHGDANPASGDDTTAPAGLPVSATNPVNTSIFIWVKPASARANGIGGSCMSGLGGGYDGVINFNASIVDVNGGIYSLLATIQHEIDEVMGLGSSLPSFSDPMPQDLFRYASTPGVRIFASNASCAGPPQAFFSIDGTTHLNEFYNCDGADYGDWVTHTPSQVQDAITLGIGNPFLTTGLSEVRALDVIGYGVINPNGRRGQTVSE